MIDAVAMEVAHEHAVAVPVRPVFAEVDHGPDVRMAAAGVTVLALAGARTLPRTARPVKMIGAGVDQTVAVGVEVLAIHALEMGARHHVPEMADDAVGDEHLAVV